MYFTMYYKTLKYTYSDTDNELVLNFELAGKSKENVKIFTSNKALNIKVDDKQTFAVDFEDYLYDVNDYDFESVTAKMNNGLLSVKLPKKKERLRTIQIE